MDSVYGEFWIEVVGGEQRIGLVPEAEVPGMWVLVCDVYQDGQWRRAEKFETWLDVKMLSSLTRGAELLLEVEALGDQ